jgi:hypothetical protein
MNFKMCISKKRTDLVSALLIVVIGTISQVLWDLATHIGWGWDSVGYLSIGRMLLGMPYEMWNLKYYYPPGVSLLMIATGVYNLDTLVYYNILVFLMSSLMPLLLFIAFRRYHYKAAFLGAVIFSLIFGGSIYSNEIMSNHAGMFFSIFLAALLLNLTPNSKIYYAAGAGFVAFMAAASRSANMYLFIGFLPILYIIYKNSNLNDKKRLAILGGIGVITFAVCVLALSLTRSLATNEKFRFEIARDLGARTALLGAYTGGSFFLNTEGNYPLVTPANGIYSKEFFLRLNERFSKIKASDTPLGDIVEKDGAAVEYIIHHPNLPNYYEMWFGIDSVLNIDAADRLVKNVLLETIVAQPRIFRYYMWNFYNYFFGPLMIINTSKKCTVDCFVELVPNINNGYFNSDVFKKVIGPGVIGEVDLLYKDQSNNPVLVEYINYVLRIFYSHKTIFVLMMLSTIFVVEPRIRPVSLFLIAISVLSNITTSAVLPPLDRYWYPILPWVILGASLFIVTVFEKLVFIFKAYKLPRHEGGR